MNRFFILTAFGFGSFLTFLPASWAVIISPVQLDLSLRYPVASFTVTNDSEFPITYQASTLSWTQIDVQDIQLATQDLILTPPIVTIKSRSSQVFRVGLFKKPDNLVELSYRVILEDISSDVTEKTDAGLRFRFNHDLPLFYAPLSNNDLIVWSLCASSVIGKSCLMIENKGNRHAKIVKLTALSANLVEASNLSKTLLAGNSGQWLFPTMIGSENTTSIELITNKGPLTLTIKDLPRFK